MEKITSEWNGFRSEIFEFNGQRLFFRKIP